MGAESYLPYRLGYLTDWMVKQAEEELNETEKNRTEALQELRRLIASEKNFDVWTDDSYLLQFLRARKFDPHRAMQLLRNLYSLFKKFPDVFPKTMDTALLASMMYVEAAAPFPYRHKDGGAIYFLKVSNWDPEKHPVEIAAAAATFMPLCIVDDPASQICGVYFILDAELHLKQLRHITPSILRILASILVDTVPIRIKEIHIINESPVFRYLFNLLKIFLTDKIKKRFHFHGRDLKQLHTYIPKEILPSDFGGDITSYSANEMCEKEFGPFIKKLEEMLNKGYL